MQTLLSPVSFLERSAAAFPDRVAVIDEERRLTWAELRERARRLAVGLQRSGIEKDDRVAYLALNTTELLEAHFGVRRSAPRTCACGRSTRRSSGGCSTRRASRT